MARMFKSREKFIDCVGPKRIADLGPIEGHAYRAMFDRTVIGDIGEIETRHYPPSGGVEDVRNVVLAHGFILSDENVIRPFLY